jgi:pyridoxal biosynthesis lyase PdxS
LLLAQELRAPVELVRQTKALGRLPVVNFAAGGVATPADAALMMQLGMDGVFVGSGIFKSGDPAKRARAIVQVGAARSSGVLQQRGCWRGRQAGMLAGPAAGCSA